MKIIIIYIIYENTNLNSGLVYASPKGFYGAQSGGFRCTCTMKIILFYSKWFLGAYRWSDTSGFVIKSTKAKLLIKWICKAEFTHYSLMKWRKKGDYEINTLFFPPTGQWIWLLFTWTPWNIEFTIWLLSLFLGYRNASIVLEIVIPASMFI